MGELRTPREPSSNSVGSCFVPYAYDAGMVKRVVLDRAKLVPVLKGWLRRAPAWVWGKEPGYEKLRAQKRHDPTAEHGTGRTLRRFCCGLRLPLFPYRRWLGVQKRSIANSGLDGLRALCPAFGELALGVATLRRFGWRAFDELALGVAALRWFRRRGRALDELALGVTARRSSEAWC